ncbi:hypothetical protein AAII07_49530 [Microvirga sp. 0TCS3.31]
MPEVIVSEITVGDEVRVHFHPPYPMQNFCEGTVSRVDVTHEVILDREHPIRRGFQDYVRYDSPNDFSGRIEVFSTAEQATISEPLPTALEAQEVIAQGADEPLSYELDVHPGPEIEQTPEAETKSEAASFNVEPQPTHKQSGLLATLFGRKKEPRNAHPTDGPTFTRLAKARPC